MPQGPTGARSQAADGGERMFPIAFGNVELVRQLSTDRRGEVYIATRLEGPDRLCVVNVLGELLTRRPGMRDELRAEAAWLVSRVHGNLVQVYDVGSTAQSGGPTRSPESWVGPLPSAPDHDRLFFTCELVEGRDLATFLKRAEGSSVRVPPELAVHIAMEFAFALEFIRSNEFKSTGVSSKTVGLHAGAVLLGVDGSVKLTHYGACLAPRIQDLEDGDLGRASLLPPEVLRGEVATERSDVFAAAALLWQTLTGRPLALKGTTLHIESLRKGTWSPEAPSKLEGPVRSIPHELDVLLLQALNPDPQQRPADVAAFRAELAAFQKSRNVPVGHAEVRGFVNELFGRELAQDAADLTAIAARAEAENLVSSSPGARNTTNTLTDFHARRIRTPLGVERELAIGEVIPGSRYRALAKLGEGGMGVVYAAEHVDIEKRVALKLLHADLLENQHVLQQFRQEARAASRIGNPYICDVTDWGEIADGRVFFVMEYLDGVSLSREIKRCRRLPPDRAIPMLRLVAKALGAAHQKGIVHLDMKPDNVLLIEKDGRKDYVKVVDFGIAGLLGQAGIGGKVMGTPEYMAPERTLGGGNDRRSDIYALGVMAYEMLSGEVPFQGLTPVETLAMQATDRPDPINERVTKSIPKVLDDVVMRMLEKDPLLRPQTMAEVEALLCEAQLDARIKTTWDDLALPLVDAARLERLSKRYRSHSSPRMGVIFAAAAALVLAAVGITAVALSRSPVSVVVDNGPDSVPLSPVPAASSTNKVAIPSAPLVPRPLAPAPVVADGEKRAFAKVRAKPESEGTPTNSAVPVVPTTNKSAAASEEPRDPDEGVKRSGADRSRAKEATDRGMVSLDSGQSQLARQEFEVAIKADSNYAPAVGGLAEVEFEASNYAAAAKLSSKAVRLSPNVTRYLLLLADARFRLRQYAQSAEVLEKAQAIEPNNTDITRRLERVKLQMPVHSQP